jgi:hypothetical protein
VDEYGDPTLTETTEDARCEIQESTSSEEDLEQVETTEQRVWFDATVTPPRGGDALIVDTKTYEFTGDANLWFDPFDATSSHVEGRVRRVS